VSARASLPFVVGVLALVVAAPSAALARSSRRTDRRNDNRYRGPYRLISGQRGDDKKRQQQEEQKRKKLLEEQKRLMEERQRQREEAIKRLEEMRKRALEAQKKAAQSTARKPQPKKSTAAEKQGPGAQSQSAEEREQEAQQLVDEAFGQLQKGEPDALVSAAKALRQVVNDYGGTPAAVKAEAQLDLLLTTEPFGPIILLGEGEEMFSAQRYRCAQNKYRALLQRFPDSEQAAKARERLAEIKENDLLSKSVYTDEELEDARLWFLAGSIHLQNGRRNEAIAAFRKVAEEYPGSRYAVMAKEKLETIRGS